MQEINFLGLGFEMGQERSGLKSSHEHARRYFPLLEDRGIKIFDCGEIVAGISFGTKIHSSGQIRKVDWNPYKQAYDRIHTLLQKPRTLLNWGGDHSVALATVGAFCSRYPDGHVVWIDAHTDINLPGHSLSGNLHGMPLSILLNVHDIATKHFPWLRQKLSARKLIYVGVRDLDPFEKEIVRQLGIQTYTTSDIREAGMEDIARRILSKVGSGPLHVSFDIDSLSPDIAPATGVPVQDGLNVQDVEILGRTLSRHRQLCSVDVVEINPFLGSAEEVFQTYFAAMDFLMSLFRGGLHDGIGRSTQAIHTASLESRLQI